jgi:hypothetical protein
MTNPQYAFLVLGSLLSFGCAGSNAVQVPAANSSAQTNQERIIDVEYMAGHTGLDNKTAGHLLLTNDMVLFTKLDDQETPIFSMPLESITEVTNAVDRKEASVGSKIMFGFLAKSRKEELVQISTAGPAGAEGVVFRVRKNQSVGIVAKIRYRMQALKNREPATTQTSAVTEQVSSAPKTVHPASAEAMPPGTNWIANRTTKIYYQARCAVQGNIASTDRVFYVTESAALLAGFTLSHEC